MTAPVPPPMSWKLAQADAGDIALRVHWSEAVTPEWAWGGSGGAGVRVCVVDSGVEPDHPLVGGLEQAVAVEPGPDGEPRIVQDTLGDLCGHGTACAGIVRALAPACGISSVRVLGAHFAGSGTALLTGLRWAVEQGFHVVNLSLSTTRRQYLGPLHEVADRAYFGRTLLVASAHNVPIESFPWRFSSVVSVGSHQEQEPHRFYYNPTPPVEFFARGVDVPVAWRGGGRITCSGNSFATPHITALCAMVLGKHPGLTPFQVKCLLSLTAANVTKVEP